MSDDGIQVKSRLCNICQKVDKEEISYAVDEQTFKNAFIKVRNFTASSNFESSDMTYSMLSYLNNEYGKIVINKVSSGYEYSTTTYLEIQKDKMFNYIYDKNLEIYVKKEMNLTYFPLKDYDNLIDAFYASEFDLAIFCDVFSSLTFDKNDKCYKTDKSSVTSPMNSDYSLEFTNFKVKFVNNKLISLSYDLEEGQCHISLYDFGTTTFDLTVIETAHEHTFDTSKWEHSEENHWHPYTCEHHGREEEILNKGEGNFANHVFTDGACSVCGYVCEHVFMNINGTYYCQYCGTEHVHDEPIEGKYYCLNEYYHCLKYKCGHLAEEYQYMAEHEFVDCVCTGCGFTLHEYSYKYSSDSESHWKEITCSHADSIENITKEAHDFTSFKDFCTICYYSTKDDFKGEEVNKEIWDRNFQNIDLSHMTIIDNNYKQIKRDGYIYQSKYGSSSSFDLLYSNENDKHYIFEYYNNVLLKREFSYYSNEYVNEMLRLYSEKVALLEAIKTFDFSKFSYNENGYYEFNSSDEEECVIYYSDYAADLREVAIKFKDGKLEIVSSNYDKVDESSSYIAPYLIYDFGSTTIEINEPYKTYNYTGEYIYMMILILATMLLYMNARMKKFLIIKFGTSIILN